MKKGVLFFLIFYAMFSYAKNPSVILEYDTVRTVNCCSVLYSDTTGNEYLREFRRLYQLDQLIADQRSDIDKATVILHWAHSKWEHLGGKSSEVDDAFYILEKVAEGSRFSCSEFATVFVTAANAVGITARKVNLKTKDAATAQSGAGHSLAEVYLNDMGKWVLFDPQNDLVPFCDSIPLNAYEFKLAINQHPEKIDYQYKGNWTTKDFGKQITNWFYPYLYFFDTAFDNRYKSTNAYKCKGNENLILVPLGEDAPKVFQVYYPLDGYQSTHSLADFYQKPVTN
ncbi:MAG: transglutaminase-like domain-containing protein [Thiohalospira sp.]